MARRIFISCQYEDQMKAKGFNLLRWNKNVPVEFVGRHLLDPVDSNNWHYISRKIREQLTGTSAAVLIGDTTWKSEAVAYEVEQSLKKGTPNGILAYVYMMGSKYLIHCETAVPRSLTGTRMNRSCYGSSRVSCRTGQGRRGWPGRRLSLRTVNSERNWSQQIVYPGRSQLHGRCRDRGEDVELRIVRPFAINWGERMPRQPKKNRTSAKKRRLVFLSFEFEKGRRTAWDLHRSSKRTLRVCHF